MRLLVACPECRRQYDATRRAIGSRFRCHCGALVDVKEPVGHDARVVRCSSCGAPRHEQSESCPFCGSDFTLQERDLHTVCPHCLAWVSDQARFSHHCGTGLVPELECGAETSFACPACQGDERLTSRRLGAEQVTVLECGRCGGLWLGPEAFRQLAERAKHEALPTRGPVGPMRAVAGAEAAPEERQHGSFYRPCIVCGQLMNRVNYGHTSGVILDICKDHGIWFDADELARVLAWLRAGGQETTAETEERKTRSTHTDAASASQLSSHPSWQTVLDFLDGLLGGPFR
jgi:Zn-finger nucleic acid-binding protein